VTTHFADEGIALYHGDSLKVARTLPDAAADCIVTSPPYFGLRDYGIDGQYGLESSPAEYVETMRALFSELRRVLADDGTLWLNIGDSYSRNPAKGGSGTPNGRNVAEMGYPDKRWREGAARADGSVRADGQSRRNRNGCLNGDLPEKNLLGIPWRVAFALQDDGWILRNAIIWNKPNAMPESATDRLSGRYESVFMLSKQTRYWFDLDSIREPYAGERALSRRSRTGHTNKENSAKGAWGIHKRTTDPVAELASIASAEGIAGNTNGPAAKQPLGRNPGDVWDIPTQPFSAAHFAVMPQKLAARCIMAGCKPGGTVLDPFSGSGTTGMAAQQLGRKYIGIDLNAEYLDLSLKTRLHDATIDFGEGA
jgi:DNA modification methylase